MLVPSCYTFGNPPRPVPLPPTLRTADGLALRLVDWTGDAARGTVLIVHGLGEHAERYGHVAQWLATRGFRVVGYDQRGHGQSEGMRGDVPSATALLEDLELVVDAARPATGPLILLGHSMGGAIAARFVAEERRRVDFLILTSPALAAELSFGQRLQLWIGERVVPSIAVSNQLDVQRISHDSAVVRAYLEDPLVHDRLSPRLARMVLQSGEYARAAASHWTVPTLLLYAGADALVSPSGSDAFAAAAPRALVDAERFEGLYHEILNEDAQRAEPVFDRLQRWLNAKVPRPTG